MEFVKQVILVVSSKPYYHFQAKLSQIICRRTSVLRKENSEGGKASEARNAIQQQLSRKGSSGRIGALAATSEGTGELGLTGICLKLGTPPHEMMHKAHARATDNNRFALPCQGSWERLHVRQGIMNKQHNLKQNEEIMPVP